MTTQQRYSTPLVIPSASATADAKTNEELLYIYSALRTLAIRLDQVSGALSAPRVDWGSIKISSSVLGGRMYKVYARAAVAISYGAMVNLYNLNSTEVQARYARANSNSTAASAFCNVPGGVAAGEFGEFIVGPGINSGIAGLTPGSWYFLSHTSLTGQISAGVPPPGAGNIYQNCGIALSDNELMIGALNSWFNI